MRLGEYFDRHRLVVVRAVGAAMLALLLYSLWHLVAARFPNKPVAPARTSKSSHLILRANDGTTAAWTVERASLRPSAPLPKVAPPWFIAGIADVNGDGALDIVWQDPRSGTVAIWIMDDALGLVSNYTLDSPGPDWKVIAVGDLGGDRHADLVFRNGTTTQVIVWYLDSTGKTVARTASFGPVSAVWQLVQPYDLDGDGVKDLFWYNTQTTEVVVWLMKAEGLSRPLSLGSGGPGWVMSRVGDFDGDGKPDLFWRNSTSGVSAIWHLEGGSVRAAESIAGMPPDWTPVASDDYDADGIDDLLWLGKTGDVVEWQMHGINVTPTAIPLGNVGPDWLPVR